MRNCETCGRAIDEAHPFRVCPVCLFGEALRIDEPESSASIPGEAQKIHAFAPAPRLFVRRDFFQKYDILEKVGQGGQGDIWKVWDFELHRCLAMKRLGEQALASEPAVYRFLAEAQIASQLEHPGILPIMDVGLDPDGRPFYTTQLLPGATLGDVWRKVHDREFPEWTISRALELLLRVCEVMAHAHSRGVIHRDLKPANILVGPFGEVRVIDWGSAHVLAETRKQFAEPFVTLNRQTIHTDRGDAMWAMSDSPLATSHSGQPITILFTPPEILRGESDQLGPPTDIYSMGVMLYELLAARPPYSKTDHTLPDPAELRELIRAGSPPPVRSLKRAVSRDLAAICQQAMAHSKAERYRTMEELAEDIRAALEVRPVRARKPGPVLRLQKWAQRNIPYVLLGGAILLILSVAFAIARGLTAEWNAAQQLTALRGAELAAHSGRWREALRLWGEAEASGYNDSIYLGLQRAEAWTILNEPSQSAKELTQLSQRSDLGNQHSLVLLRLGEHELFDQATANQGVEHVREALKLGLTGAEELYAKGLLADSTPEALDFFHRALQINSFHHGAHVQSMGLEFVLGRRTELQESFRFFAALYPDDPSAGYLEAAELALHGRLPEAQTRLASLRHASGTEEWERLHAALPALAATANHYDLDTLLASPRPAMPTLEFFAISGGDSAAGGTVPNATPDKGRTARLPCLQKGLLEGRAALSSMMIPFLGDIESSVKRIKSSWQHHPEALVPAYAGIYLETRQPTNGPKFLPLLQIQADLFQLAADSPALLPGLDRTARYLAAKAEFELSQSGSTNAAPARSNCLANIRHAAAAAETSAAACRAYFEIAFALGDLDLARALLYQWELQKPADQSVMRARIQLETAAGAFGSALKFIDQLLVEKPDNPWAMAQRDTVKKKTNEMLDSIQSPPKLAP